MTVAVACNLSDGVVLGVDSAVTLSTGDGILKVFESAEKLFQLGKLPIGIAVYGMAGIQDRSLGSHIREFEITNPSGVMEKAKLSDLVEQLRKFFWACYTKNVIPEVEKSTGKKFDELPDDIKQGLSLGLIVGGFSHGEYLSEVWHILLPNHAAEGSAELLHKQGDFRSGWFATFLPIARYLKGFDFNAIGAVMSEVKTMLGRDLADDEQAKIWEAAGSQEYQIPFNSMPINVGVEYVRFLVDLVINHHKFAVGAPVVGGKARVGLVKYDGEQFKILS
jgi:hypothetical protein